MPRSRGRTGRPWRRLRAQVIAQEQVCCICGNDVDKTLPYPHPLSPSVEHKIPLSRGGPDLPSRTGVGLAHLGCNSAKGNRERMKHKPQRVSRDW